MSRERGPLVPLEQSCRRPGQWLIEGYDVWRVRDWPETYWQIARFGQHAATAATLADAREWIRDQISK